MDLYLPNRPKYVNFILRSHILILLRTFLFEYDRIILLDSSLLFSNPSFLTLYFYTSWSKSFGLILPVYSNAVRQAPTLLLLPLLLLLMLKIIETITEREAKRIAMRKMRRMKNKIEGEREQERGL